jgi:hypothetical protein
LILTNCVRPVYRLEPMSVKWLSYRACMVVAKGEADEFMVYTANIQI